MDNRFDRLVNSLFSSAFTKLAEDEPSGTLGSFWQGYINAYKAQNPNVLKIITPANISAVKSKMSLDDVLLNEINSILVDIHKTHATPAFQTAIDVVSYELLNPETRAKIEPKVKDLKKQLRYKLYNEKLLIPNNLPPIKETYSFSRNILERLIRSNYSVIKARRYKPIAQDFKRDKDRFPTESMWQEHFKDISNARGLTLNQWEKYIKENNAENLVMFERPDPGTPVDPKAIFLEEQDPKALAYSDKKFDEWLISEGGGTVSTAGTIAKKRQFYGDYYNAILEERGLPNIPPAPGYSYRSVSEKGVRVQVNVEDIHPVKPKEKVINRTRKPGWEVGFVADVDETYADGKGAMLTNIRGQAPLLDDGTVLALVDDSSDVKFDDNAKNIYVSGYPSEKELEGLHFIVNGIRPATPEELALEVSSKSKKTQPLDVNQFFWAQYLIEHPEARKIITPELIDSKDEAADNYINNTIKSWEHTRYIPIHENGSPFVSKANPKLEAFDNELDPEDRKIKAIVKGVADQVRAQLYIHYYNEKVLEPNNLPPIPVKKLLDIQGMLPARVRSPIQAQEYLEGEFLHGLSPHVTNVQRLDPEFVNPTVVREPEPEEDTDLVLGLQEAAQRALKSKEKVKGRQDEISQKAVPGKEVPSLLYKYVLSLKDSTYYPVTVTQGTEEVTYPAARAGVALMDAWEEFEQSVGGRSDGLPEGPLTVSEIFKDIDKRAEQYASRRLFEIKDEIASRKGKEAEEVTDDEIGEDESGEYTIDEDVLKEANKSYAKLLLTKLAGRKKPIRMGPPQELPKHKLFTLSEKDVLEIKKYAKFVFIKEVIDFLNKHGAGLPPISFDGQPIEQLIEKGKKDIEKIQEGSVAVELEKEKRSKDAVEINVTGNLKVVKDNKTVEMAYLSPLQYEARFAILLDLVNSAQNAGQMPDIADPKANKQLKNISKKQILDWINRPCSDPSVPMTRGQTSCGLKEEIKKRTYLAPNPAKEEVAKLKSLEWLEQIVEKAFTGKVENEALKVLKALQQASKPYPDPYVAMGYRHNALNSLLQHSELRPGGTIEFGGTNEDLYWSNFEDVTKKTAPFLAEDIIHLFESLGREDELEDADVDTIASVASKIAWKDQKEGDPSLNDALMKLKLDNKTKINEAMQKRGLFPPYKSGVFGRQSLAWLYFYKQQGKKRKAKKEEGEAEIVRRLNTGDAKEEDGQPKGFGAYQTLITQPSRYIAIFNDIKNTTEIKQLNEKVNEASERKWLQIQKYLINKGEKRILKEAVAGGDFQGEANTQIERANRIRDKQYRSKAAEAFNALVRQISNGEVNVEQLLEQKGDDKCTKGECAEITAQMNMCELEFMNASKDRNDAFNKAMEKRGFYGAYRIALVDKTFAEIIYDMTYHYKQEDKAIPISDAELSDLQKTIARAISEKKTTKREINQYVRRNMPDYLGPFDRIGEGEHVGRTPYDILTGQRAAKK